MWAAAVRRAAPACAALLLWPCVAPVDADVFLRGRLPRDGSEIEVLADGRHAYSSDVHFNGQPGRVRVSWSPHSPEEIQARVDAALGNDTVGFVGDSMGRGIRSVDGGVTRYLLLPTDSGVAVFSLHQDARAYAASRKTEGLRAPPETPLPPGARPTLVLRDRSRRMALTVAQADGVPEDLFAAIEREFGAGWQAIETVAGAAARTYVRRDATRVVAMRGAGRFSTITVLHKDGAVE